MTDKGKQSWIDTLEEDGDKAHKAAKKTDKK